MASATVVVLGLAALTALALLPGAEAAAIIDNGVVQLGVLDAGNLNVPGGTPSSGTGTTTVGVRYLPTGAEATAPGCTCEGWGVAYDGSVSGWADIGGPQNLAVVSFSQPDPQSAVSVAQVGALTVTHDYHPSAVPELYEATVTIHNGGTAAVGDVRYRRAMDWDVEPTAFHEYVSIHAGSPPASNLLFSSDDGFASANPLAGPSSILVVGPPANPDFDDSGPADHGALFDFGFGSLAPGASRVFKIFYGAAGSEADALAALAAVNAEVWSLGQPATPDGPTKGTPNTFMFGFGGVGGKQQCDGYVKHGRAATVLGAHEDVGGTGLVGPGAFGVHDSGDVDTATTLFASDSVAWYSGPLAEARALAHAFAHTPCEAYAETVTAEVETGPAVTAVQVHAKGVEAWARVSCYAIAAHSTVAWLEVDGNVVVDTSTAYPPNTVVDLGVVRVVLNEQYAIPNGIAVNVARIVAPGVADVQIGHAEASITPCGPVVRTCDGLVVGVRGDKTCPHPDCPPMVDVGLGLGGVDRTCVECAPSREGGAVVGPRELECDPSCEDVPPLLAPLGIAWDCGGCIAVDGTATGTDADVTVCVERPCDPAIVLRCVPAGEPCEFAPAFCVGTPCGASCLDICTRLPALCADVATCRLSEVLACLPVRTAVLAAPETNPNGVAWTRT